MGSKMSSEDRYERELGKADAARLVRDAQLEARAIEMRRVLEVWAASLVNRLDPILDDAAFGKDTTRHSLDFDGDNDARLTYERTHKRLRLHVTTSAHYNGLVLVGEDHRELENTARMNVTLHRSDTNETRTAEYRYSLQPAGKTTSINQERFTQFIEDLVKGFGSGV